jgi:hypothetical protein
VHALARPAAQRQAARGTLLISYFYTRIAFSSMSTFFHLEITIFFLLSHEIIGNYWKLDDFPRVAAGI